MKEQSSSAPPGARVYSYLRFSDVRQKAGTSIERQEEYAAKYARENGMELDTQLTLRDEGLSAYHQKHVKKGALGVFLKAIEDGRVPSGSVLIVESLDRLSRAEPMIAQAQLNSIVLADVEVITASDKMRYSRETVKANPGILFMALGVMLRANNESEEKSKRVRGAARAQIAGWEKGEYRGRITVGKDPGWVYYDKAAQKFRLDNKVVTPIRALLKLYRQGYSMRRCFDELQNKGIEVPPGFANTTRLHALLKNRALVGEKVVELKIAAGKSGQKTEKKVLPGFYPAVLSEADWAELQYVQSQRGRNAKKGSVVSFVTGMRLTFCARCGYAMGNQNVMTRNKREDGLPQVGHRRMYCTGRTQSDRQARCKAESVSIVPVERAILDYCSDQMNLASLYEDGDDRMRELQGALAIARQEHTKLEKQANAFIAMVQIGGENTPHRVLAKIQENERAIEQLNARIAHLEYGLDALQRHTTPDAAEVWASLREDVIALDTTARIKARALVMDTFERIDVGKVNSHGKEHIEIRLKSKQGIVRLLRVDRQTGERLDEQNVENLQHEGLKPERKLRKLRKVEPA